MQEIVKKIEDGKLLLEISKEIYDKDAIIVSSYKFTEKAYIYISPLSEFKIGVYFKAKEGNEEMLEEIAYKFCNELIDQQVRLNLENKYSNIRNLIVKHAFSPIENLEDEVKSRGL